MQQIVSDLRNDSTLSKDGISQDKWDYTAGFFLAREPDTGQLGFREGPLKTDPFYIGLGDSEMRALAEKRNLSEGDVVAVYLSKSSAGDVGTPLYITLIYNSEVHNVSIYDRLDFFKEDPEFKPPHPILSDWNSPPAWF
jgi:hypothetical protein